MRAGTDSLNIQMIFGLLLKATDMSQGLPYTEVQDCVSTGKALFV